MTEAAAKIGFSYGYLAAVVVGKRELSDSARVKIARAFPETSPWILQLNPTAQEQAAR
jgi:hypothetical protein